MGGQPALERRRSRRIEPEVWKKNNCAGLIQMISKGRLAWGKATQDEAAVNERGRGGPQSLKEESVIRWYQPNPSTLCLIALVTCMSFGRHLA